MPRKCRVRASASGDRTVPTLGEVLDGFGARIPFNLEIKSSRVHAYPGIETETLAALDRRFHAFDVKSGETLWETRLGTSVQGFPVTYTAGGRQYVAVTTGASGGGSPRVVPRTIIPDVKMPGTGNALYVFALPEWLSWVVLVVVVIGGALGLLRPAKGIMVALQYKHRAGEFGGEH